MTMGETNFSNDFRLPWTDWQPFNHSLCLDSDKSGLVRDPTSHEDHNLNVSQSVLDSAEHFRQFLSTACGPTNDVLSSSVCGPDVLSAVDLNFPTLPDEAELEKAAEKDKNDAAFYDIQTLLNAKSLPNLSITSREISNAVDMIGRVTCTDNKLLLQLQNQSQGDTRNCCTICGKVFRDPSQLNSDASHRHAVEGIIITSEGYLVLELKSLEDNMMMHFDKNVPFEKFGYDKTLTAFDKEPETFDDGNLDKNPASILHQHNNPGEITTYEKSLMNISKPMYEKSNQIYEKPTFEKSLQPIEKTDFDKPVSTYEKFSSAKSSFTNSSHGKTSTDFEKQTTVPSESPNFDKNITFDNSNNNPNNVPLEPINSVPFEKSNPEIPNSNDPPIKSKKELKSTLQEKREKLIKVLKSKNAQYDFPCDKAAANGDPPSDDNSDNFHQDDLPEVSGQENNGQPISESDSLHKCSDCGHSFKSEDEYLSHVKTHYGNNEERPFPCKMCSKRFHKRSLLRQHSVVHTKERPFQCKICKKKFTRGKLSNIKM